MKNYTYRWWKGEKAGEAYKSWVHIYNPGKTDNGN